VGAIAFPLGIAFGMALGISLFSQFEKLMRIGEKK
jgi:hypothetical protein